MTDVTGNHHQAKITAAFSQMSHSMLWTAHISCPEQFAAIQWPEAHSPALNSPEMSSSRLRSATSDSWPPPGSLSYTSSSSIPATKGSPSDASCPVIRKFQSLWRSEWVIAARVRNPPEVRYRQLIKTAIIAVRTMRLLLCGLQTSLAE